MVLLLSGCFPTLHTARIADGLHLDAGVTVINDQRRNDRDQAPDVIPYVAPVLGIGGWVELGLPVGVYMEGQDDFGADATELGLWPYVKLSLLGPGGRDHLALVLQGVLTFPASLGLRYGRELEGWEPHVGVSYLFSAGPAGDDPIVPRYQELGQSLVALGGGATWLGSLPATVEAGVLINRFREGAVLGDFGQPTVPRTLVDLYGAVRLRL